MAAAHATPIAPPAPTPAPEPARPESGWRARMKQAQQRVEYNQNNGFNGVPLPEEPPEEPEFSAPEQAREQEENELLEDLDNSSGQLDHRTPLDVASEMIEKHLGGQRVR